MRKIILFLLLILITINGYSLTRLDNLKLELKSASGLQEILILDELQRSYWKIYPKASLKYGNKALSVSSKINNKLQQTQQMQNIGVSYSYLDKYDRAIEYMIMSLVSANVINNIDLQIDAYYYLATYNNIINKNVIAF